MFFKRKKLTAPEAKILSQIGLQKTRSQNEVDILKDILRRTKRGDFSMTFRKGNLDEHLQRFVEGLGYVVTDAVYEDWEYRPPGHMERVEHPGTKVSWE